jgi:hypothetical protein
MCQHSGHRIVHRGVCPVYQCCGSGSGIRCLFDLWIRDPGWVKKSGHGSGIRIRDKQPGSYFQELIKQFFGLKYLNYLMWIRDPGWEKFGSGMEKGRIRDPVWTSRIRNTAIYKLTKMVPILKNFVVDPDPVGSEALSGTGFDFSDRNKTVKLTQFLKI